MSEAAAKASVVTKIPSDQSVTFPRRPMISPEQRIKMAAKAMSDYYRAAVRLG